MTPRLWLPLLSHPGGSTGHRGITEGLPLHTDIQFLGTEEGLDPLFVAEALALQRPGSPKSIQPRLRP